MDIRKYAATTLIAAVVGGLSGYTSQYLAPQRERVMVEKVRVAASKHAWPDLTMDETIAIGEAMKGPLKGLGVQIFCNESSCDDLAHDIDDAMQIADVGSSLEKSVTSLGYGINIVVGSGGNATAAKALADTIASATSGKLKPGVKQANVADGSILIAIGKQR